MQIPSKNIIEGTILQNYIEYQHLFVEFQSKFLSGLYSRYQSVESGNLVLYYARQAHQDILRKKDYDLNYNLSLEKFWENHDEINPACASIIKIGEETLLPKETARRKILQLIKQKVLNKKNRNIGWLPNEQYKQSYNLFINQEVEDVVKLINYVCKKINFPISSEVIMKEVKEKFSFYWFHYLGAQLEYLRLWNKQFNDLELVLIFLQVVNLLASKTKDKNFSHKALFDNPILINEFKGSSISATSISEVTGIPRATCVRKLEFLVKLKIISQDKISKRYYLISTDTLENSITRSITEKIVKLFSEFYFICIRAINIRTLS
jgi:hypothetical protein